MKVYSHLPKFGSIFSEEYKDHKSVEARYKEGVQMWEPSMRIVIKCYFGCSYIEEMWNKLVNFLLLNNHIVFLSASVVF